MVSLLFPAFLRVQSSATQTMASTFTQRTQGTFDQIKGRCVKDWPTLPPALSTWLELYPPKPSNQQASDRHLDSDRLQISHLHNHHTLGTSQQGPAPKAGSVPLLQDGPAHQMCSTPAAPFILAAGPPRRADLPGASTCCHFPPALLAHYSKAHGSQGWASSLSGVVLVCQPCKSLGCSILTNSTPVNAERTHHTLQGCLHLAQLGSFPCQTLLCMAGRNTPLGQHQIKTVTQGTVSKPPHSLKQTHKFWQSTDQNSPKQEIQPSCKRKHCCPPHPEVLAGNKPCLSYRHCSDCSGWQVLTVLLGPNIAHTQRQPGHTKTARAHKDNLLGTKTTERLCGQNQGKGW